MASPRLSPEKILQNRGDPIAVTTVQNVGAGSNRGAITCTDTATQILIGAGKRTIELYNNDTANDIYYGGSGVLSTTGILIPYGQGKIWSNVKDDFSIYIICATGLTANIRCVEYT